MMARQDRGRTEIPRCDQARVDGVEVTAGRLAELPRQGLWAGIVRSVRARLTHSLMQFRPRILRRSRSVARRGGSR